MWQTSTTDFTGGRRYFIVESGAPITLRRFFDLLRSEAAFINWYSTTVAAFEAEACYWELPPLTVDTVGNDAEFVLMDAPLLTQMPPEPEVFESHCRSQPDDEVVIFPNLGHDATLVVPCPRAPDDVYPHLLSFLRGGPREQIRALWRVTAVTLMENLTDAPVWLSTAGGGVAWLHLRLDSRPKYIQFEPYRVLGQDHSSHSPR